MPGHAPAGRNHRCLRLPRPQPQRPEPGRLRDELRNASAISPPGTLAPYAPHALWVFLDLVEAAIHTGRRKRPPPTSPPPASATSTGFHPACGWSFSQRGHRQPPADIASLERAIAEPGNDRWPFDLARIQLTYGSHLRRLKRTTDARRQLADAAEIFHRLGATPWAARANSELRATGITVAKADTGLASLTPQQREIALLAAAGQPTRRSPPASSSRRERSPPTSTRSSPNSASPPGPPSGRPRRPPCRTTNRRT